MPCGHAFCNGCWLDYFRIKVRPSNAAVGRLRPSRPKAHRRAVASVLRAARPHPAPRLSAVAGALALAPGSGALKHHTPAAHRSATDSRGASPAWP